MREHEFAIIERYFKTISKTSDGVILGPGDDCAILSFPEEHEACVSTDTLVEQVHFPKDCPAGVVASRTMGANLSDLAAMGATPHSFLLAMTLPGVDEIWLGEFSETLSGLIDQYRVPLAGGNLSRGPLSLTVTIIGTVPAGEAVRRNTARADDEIYVTGTLGDASQGLEHVRQGQFTGYLASRYCTPTPRIKAGELLRDVATSMIDLSDGLMADLGHICEASELGAVVDASMLPLSRDLKLSAGFESAIRLALSAGDDYELCFTVDPDDVDRMQGMMKSLGLKVTRVGQMRVDRDVLAVDGDGKPLRHGGSGYQHF